MFDKILNIYISFVKKSVTLLVLLQFIVTVLLAWLDPKYWINYIDYISHLVGYSIVSNSIILGFVWSKPHKYCDIVRAMLIALIFSNILALLGYFNDYSDYSKQYDRFFIVAFFYLLYVYLSRKISIKNI